MDVLTTVMTSGRRIAPVSGADAWRRCVLEATQVDDATDEVLLAGHSDEPQGGWAEGAPHVERGGLCFDGRGSLYRGDPGIGQLQRAPWPRRAGVETVDLLAQPGPEIAATQGAFVPASAGGQRPLRARALALDDDDHLFVLDGASQSVAILDLADGRLLRWVAFPASPTDLTSYRRAVLVVTASREMPLARLDGIGVPRPAHVGLSWDELSAQVPESALPSRLAVDPGGDVWLLLRDGPDAWVTCASARRLDFPIHLRGARDLAFDGLGRMVLAGPPGGDLYVFDVGGPSALQAAPLSGDGYAGAGIGSTPEGRIGFWTTRGFRVARPYRVTYSGSGHVDTYALDSRAPRTVWGRVFVEACVPPGTRLELGYATTDELPPDASTAADAEPVGSEQELAQLFDVHRRETGRELAWTPLVRGDRYEVYEAPVIAPPGRYLSLRVQLTGTRTLTPRVRAVRVECESHDLLGQLPRIYRQDPVAESALRRFLAIVDGALTEIEWRAVERDKIFDPQGAPAELLPWLGSLIGLTIDHRWPERARRTLIGEAVCLFRKRGTLPGLKRLLEIYLDCPVAILEAFRVRGFGGAFVGGRDTQPDASSAIVGRSFRVGGVPSSVTGEDDPQDAFATHAHRFTVLVTRCIGDEELAVVRDLLNLHRPAHTLVQVCGSGEGMRVGMSLHVEISSILGPGSGFARAVVGSSTVGADTVLGRGRAGIRPGSTQLADRTVVDP